MIPLVGRTTLGVFFEPREYVEEDAFWERFSFHEWSGSYEWAQDPLGGWLDTPAPPRATARSFRGDCEDYALVAASWALSNGRSNVGLGFCLDDWRPAHVIAYDSTSVYSSGVVETSDPSAWLTGSGYDTVVLRPVG